MKTKFYYLACLLLVQLSVKAQMKIGNNSTTINSASLLELETTNKGLVLPRVSLTDVNSSSPLPSGLLISTVVYNTNSGTAGGSGVGIYYWDGTKWNFITNTSITSNYWSLTGNSGTNASSNFIGTLDATDFVARTANIERMRILGTASGSSKAGWIGMGVTVPRSSLDVTGHFTNKNVLTIENSSTSGFSSVDMMDSAGNLKGTFGYANTGTGGLFAGKNYFNIYGNDFIFTTNSSAYDFFMKGSSGFVGINTNTPSERLHVVGNIYLNGAFMPGGNAGTTGYVLTSAGANTSPTWNSLNGLSWGLTGNSGTSYATNFLGTTDNISMRFRTNNIQRMIIDSTGKIGIGLGNPGYALSVLSPGDPLYLSGVQATSTFTTDSLLTINAGVVKKSPYTSLTGNFWSITGNSGTNYATNFMGTTDNVSLRFRTNNTERMVIDSTGSVGIGSTNFNTYLKEKFLVDYGNAGSNNIATFKGNINDYLQIGVQNTNSGSNASSDVVATSDDGTDSTNYIDMGINSSTYAPTVDNFGGPHDGYLYTYSRNLLVGTAKTNSDIIFLVGGGQTKFNAVLRMDAATGNIIVGKGENNTNATGNIIRGPNGGNGTNIPGGSLTLQGGSSTGTATAGSVYINGGTPATGISGNVNINVNDSSATNINTGSTKANLTLGGVANNILLPKYNTAGGLFYTSLATGQLANTGTKMTWDSIHNRLGIGTTTPTAALEVTPNGTDKPLILHNVPVGDPNFDSVLSISSTGVIGYLDPSTILTYRYWGKNGNAANAGQFLGTTNNQALRFKFNNIQAGYLDDKNTQFGTSATIGAGSDNTVIGVSASAANGATAIGTKSIASGKDNTALGVTATASNSTQETAIGSSALANNQNNTAIGYSASAITNKNATAIGAGTSASGTNSTVIGANAKTTQDNAVVIGDATTAGLYVGIGTSTPSAKLDINATGANNPLEMHGVPTGDITSDNVLTINSSGVVGSVSQSTVSGSYWSLNGNAATASSVLGTTNPQPLQFQYNKLSAGAIDNNTTSLGTSSSIGAGGNNTAIGNSSSAANSGTAIGASSVATGNNSTAVGTSANASGVGPAGSQTTAIGASALASAQNNTAVGYNSSAITKQNATAIGAGTSASGTNSTVIGANAKTTQDNAVIIGDATTAGLYVGIGTSTPSSKLDIVATGAGNSPLELHGLSAGSYPTDNILSINSSGVVGYISASTLGGNYILNQTTQQASSNFNISGAGTVGGLLTSGGGHTNSGAFTTSGGIVNINTGSNFATNINTGTSNGTVTIGGASNNINLPKLSASSVVLTDASKNLTSSTPSANTYLYYNGTNFTWNTATTLGSFSATAPLTYNNTTGVFGINKSTTSTDGYLSSTDWNTFNNKVGTITLNTPSSVFSNPINFSVTSGAATGTLSLNTQTANTVFAGPAAGAAAAPTFRALVATDIPSLAGSYIQNQSTQQASSNFNISGTGTVGGLFTSNGGHTNAGVFTTSGGIANINASSNFATNVNTGTSTGNITIGNSNNNILFPKFNTTGSIFFTTGATGQINSTGTDMEWDDVNNRLGIGTTNPGSTLDVKGALRLSASTGASYVAFQSATGPGSTTYTWPSQDGANGQSLVTNGSGTLSWTPALTAAGAWTTSGNTGINANNNFIGTKDANDFVTRTNNTERMRVTSAGDVVIGSGDNSGAPTGGIVRGPSATGGNKAGADLNIQSGNGTGTGGSGDIIFSTGAAGTNNGSGGNVMSEKMRITDAGVVGIGTSSPNASTKLDVAGSVKIGASGTAIKSIQAFATTINQSVVAGGATQVYATITIPTALSSTQAVVTISPAFDLAAGIYIDDIHAISTTQIHLRLVNSTPFTVIVNGTFYVQVTEF